MAASFEQGGFHGIDHSRYWRIQRLWQGFADRMQKALADTAPDGADPGEVGRAIVDIVAAPAGKRPFRTHIDPASDGAAVTFAVMDRVREQFLARIGFPELQYPEADRS